MLISKQKEKAWVKDKKKKFVITEIEIREQCEINWDKQPMERKESQKKIGN